MFAPARIPVAAGKNMENTEKNPSPPRKSGAMLSRNAEAERDQNLKITSISENIGKQKITNVLRNLCKIVAPFNQLVIYTDIFLYFLHATPLRNSFKRECTLQNIMKQKITNVLKNAK